MTSTVPEAREPGQLLTFELCGEEYAVPLLRVQEIVEYEPVTRIPATPSFLLGVFDLRGSVLPVIDLATKLGLGATSVTRRSCIVVVELVILPTDVGATDVGPTNVGATDIAATDVAAQYALLGLLVDSVREVLTPPPADSASRSEEGGGASAAPWREIRRAGSPAIRLLDLELVMAEGATSGPVEALAQGYNEIQLGQVEPRGSDGVPESR